MAKIKLLVVLCVVTTLAVAQELNCNIQINSDQIIGSNKSVFNTLQKSMSEFVNNRRWTELAFTNTEKIECTMTVIVKKVDGDNFTCEIQVQSRRPVFNSSYYTTLFNFRDNTYNFQYKEFDLLELNENTITSNLTAVLAYYAYLIIGYDMDSYSRFGGTPYFLAAEAIVNSAQAANLDGWKAFESDKNRYALINNLTDEAFKKFRNYFYEYHRLGLDEMSQNSTNARARIVSGIPVLKDANRARPSAIVIASFMDAKTDELINILSKATEAEKKEAVEILTDVRPTQADKFQTVFK
ncbi:MAG: hypothetical protein H6Q20_1966 [Bacteroidetes bacterium]|nr:hypothetical protein [Bacteroidota bacterium]